MKTLLFAYYCSYYLTNPHHIHKFVSRLRPCFVPYINCQGFLKIKIINSGGSPSGISFQVSDLVYYYDYDSTAQRPTCNRNERHGD